MLVDGGVAAVILERDFETSWWGPSAPLASTAGTIVSTLPASTSLASLPYVIMIIPDTTSIDST